MGGLITQGPSGVSVTPRYMCPCCVGLCGHNRFISTLEGMVYIDLFWKVATSLVVKVFELIILVDYEGHGFES